MPQSSPPVDDRSQPAAPAGAAATDHLVHLPKMSTTAGVVEQDYVAINVAAVFAILLGFASILALVNSALIVIPLTAVAVAAVALRRVADSNGTQTGAGVAMCGLFLAVLAGSFVATGIVLEEFGRSADQHAIADLCQNFGRQINDQQFDKAYDLFSQRFRSRTSRQAFVRGINRFPELGRIVSANWNGVARFYTDADSGAVTARSMIVLHFANAQNPEPADAVFRKSGNTWSIDDVSGLFSNAPR